MGGGFLRFRTENMGTMPIRRIVRTTHAKDSLIDAKNLLKGYYDTNNLRPLTKFVEERLKSTPEEADVIVDFIGYLVGEMLQLHIHRDEEIDIFLDWWQIATQTKLDDWEMKSKIARFYESSVEELVEIIRRNESITAFSPHSNSDHLRILRENYDRSLPRVSRIIESIEKMENLVNLVVYMLYGLALEDIAIVENCSAEEINKKYGF